MGQGIVHSAGGASDSPPRTGDVFAFISSPLPLPTGMGFQSAFLSDYQVLKWLEKWQGSGGPLAAPASSKHRARTHLKKMSAQSPATSDGPSPTIRPHKRSLHRSFLPILWMCFPSQSHSQFQAKYFLAPWGSSYCYLLRSS